MWKDRESKKENSPANTAFRQQSTGNCYMKYMLLCPFCSWNTFCLSVHHIPQPWGVKYQPGRVPEVSYLANAPTSNCCWLSNLQGLMETGVTNAGSENQRSPCPYSPQCLCRQVIHSCVGGVGVSLHLAFCLLIGLFLRINFSAVLFTCPVSGTIKYFLFLSVPPVCTFIHLLLNSWSLLLNFPILYSV